MTLVLTNNNFPSEGELKSVSLIAKTAHASGLYGGIGGEARILMILLAAKELGIPPCMALNGGIWNIQGKVEISSRLMNSMIRQRGHTMHITSNSQECIIKGKRKDTGEEHVEKFTWAMAEKAGLSKGNVWQKYPEDMLYNRCMSRLARRLFPDVIGTSYVEGEIKESLPPSPENLPIDTTNELEEQIEEPKTQYISQEQADGLREMIPGEDEMSKFLTHIKAMGIQAFEYIPQTQYAAFKILIEKCIERRKKEAPHG